MKIIYNQNGGENYIIFIFFFIIFILIVVSVYIYLSQTTNSNSNSGNVLDIQNLQTIFQPIIPPTITGEDNRGVSSDGYNVVIWKTITDSQNNNASFKLDDAKEINIFIVGGGGNGGWSTGGGGGGGGVVMETLTLSAGTYYINVADDGNNYSGIKNTSRDSWIQKSDNSVKYIAHAGGDSYGFNPGTNRPGSGGSGAGGAWAGWLNSQSTDSGVIIKPIQGNKWSTIYPPGNANNSDHNLANKGGNGYLSDDGLKLGNGGGGGAGSVGKDAYFNGTNVIAGNGGDGITCNLPGISNYTYNGKNLGTLYWAGGGGAGATSGYGASTKAADGGKGGGGGGQTDLYDSDYTNNSFICASSGIGDKNGINPGGTYKFYGPNNYDKSDPIGMKGDSGNHGGNGGANTGGGGGGGGGSGGGGTGGSGIVIISYK